MLLAILCVFVSVLLHAQMRWDGEGNDSLWMNPVNWSSNAVPGVHDEVVLDNSLRNGNYFVKLPAGTATVSIKKITIIPATTDSIVLLLPKENVAVPGLQVSSQGYAMILHDRAVFINASGASSGLPVMISDSIRINNGGHYIHRTGRSHAANVSVLASVDGTETGIFEFDIPEASGTISLSDRVFGKLLLSSAAAGRTVHYTAAGTRGIRVRSDFVLNPAVVLNLNFSDTLLIERDFIQFASTFNCGTTARTLAIIIKGNLQQWAGGIITETGTGLPALVLKSAGLQLVRSEGSILNSIAMIIESAECRLQTPVRLPYVLKLVAGQIHTTDTSLMILSAVCSMIVDSTAGNSFINGPVLKEGLAGEHFLFPVGKGVNRRWLGLRNITGDVRVEFMKENPQLVANKLGTGLHHISSIEYWKTSGHLPAGGNVELSFDNVNSGGVTELSSLRVAIFSGDKWENGGNSFTTGNAGGSGSVVSDNLSEYGTGDRYFTLAASSSFQNPLPVIDITINAVAEMRFNVLQWMIRSETMASFFEVEASVDGRFFKNIENVKVVMGQTKYYFQDHNVHHQYYRVKTYFNTDQSHMSSIIHLRMKGNVSITIAPTVVSDRLQIHIRPNEDRRLLEGIIVSNSGNVVRKFIANTDTDRNSIDLSNLAAGVYYVIIDNRAFKFVKL
jgi:hypothetical protein